MNDLEEIIKDKNGSKIAVKLIGEDGNAFAILGRCTAAMRHAGVSEEAQTAFFKEATSGDYDALIRTAIKYFDVK